MQMILAIDQGTTGTRAILYDACLKSLCESYREHRQYVPHFGWCEHDAQEIYHNTCAVIYEAFAKARAAGVTPDSVCCAGIANQGETALAWRRSTGEPLSRAVVWHCLRTADTVAEWRKDEGLCDYVRQNTGLVINPYFSASKIRWLIDNVPAVKEALDANDLCVGTLDSFLIYRFTNGRRFVTDCATASRTMLCNIHSLDWDPYILERLQIRRETLAEILPNCADFGVLALPRYPESRIPITGAIVDQQGALFGHHCFNMGEAKVTYGTGCFLLVNTGEHPIISENGLLGTVAWKVNGRVKYALDGGIHFAGAALQWLRDNMGFISEYSDLDRLAYTLRQNDGVYFVPAFSGLAAPYWDQTARGMLIGLTMGSTKAHIIRATLESIAYQVKDLADLMEQTIKGEIASIQADGGISKSCFLMQHQADVLQRPVYVMPDCEMTARGVAMLAGLQAGILPDWNAVLGSKSMPEAFAPRISQEESDSLLRRWHDAVSRAAHWAVQ